MKEKYTRKETAIAMVFSSILVAALYGAIVCTVWAFALDSQVKKGLLWGAVIGVMIGLMIKFIQKGVVKMGNINSKESSFISGSFMSVLLFVAVILGLIAWAVRAIFF